MSSCKSVISSLGKGLSVKRSWDLATGHLTQDQAPPVSAVRCLSLVAYFGPLEASLEPQMGVNVTSQYSQRDKPIVSLVVASGRPPLISASLPKTPECIINGGLSYPKRFCNVALIGLKSLFGQASSLLLKQCPNVYNLRLYDDTDISTANDLTAIGTPCKVEAYQGKTKLNEAIQGSDIVLIGDDDLSTPLTCFDVMAPKMQDYAKAIAESSPNALIIVAASPVNKLVPVLSELLKENGYYDCNKVMGTTAVDNIRANCILASYVNTDPRKVFLPVIGGDSEDTIVPLFSQAKPRFNITEAVMKRLIGEIKQAQSLIFETKGAPEALSKAHSTIKFLNSVIAGLRGEPNIMNIAFTKTTQVDGAEYFALPVLFGRFGIQARYGIPRILPFENDLIRESVLNLKKDTDDAKSFCKSKDTAVETCSRNLAIRKRKSKEFEKFVTRLQMTKKKNNIEGNLTDKIKPPVPVKSGQLSGDMPFNTTAFCLRNQNDSSKNHKVIPAYMRVGERIMPSLVYSFQKEAGMIPNLPKSCSAETPVCEPVVCPDKPVNDKPVSYSNIVSLVERIVKKTTEKMINEKQKDESLKLNFKKLENLNVGSEKYENISHKVKKQESKISNSYCPVKSETRPITDTISGNGINNTIPTGNKSGKIDIKEKQNPRKRKYAERSLESIFKPTVNTFKQRYDSETEKLYYSKEFQQTEANQQNTPTNMHNKNHFTEMTTAKHESDNKINKKANHRAISKSQYRKNVEPIKPPISPENNSKSVTIKNIVDVINDNYTKTHKCKEKYNKKGKNICSLKSDVCKKISLNTPNVPGKNILGDDNRKNIPTNNFANVDDGAPQVIQDNKIHQDNKSESYGHMKDEKLAHEIKQENNKYFSERYTPVIQKTNETYNENKSVIKMENVKAMENLLLEDLNSSVKKEIIFPDYKKRNEEVVTAKKTENKINKNIENSKYLFKDKSCKNTKDLVKNKFRSKFSINKPLATNNRLHIREKAVTSQITESKNAITHDENKSSQEVKSICYNAFKDEVTKINNTADGCALVLPSQCSQYTATQDENHNIVKNSTVPTAVEIKSIPGSKDSNEKKNDLTLQENKSRAQIDHSSKDLNVFMKILDNDVFKDDENIAKSIQDKATEKCSEKIQSEIKLFPGPQNLQILYQNKNPEATEMNFEAIIKEMKSSIRPSKPSNQSADVSNSNKIEKLIPDVKQTIAIKSPTINHNDKKKERFDSFSQSKEPISQPIGKDSPVSNKNVQKLIPEVKKSIKKTIFQDNSPVKSRVDKTSYNPQNTAKSSDKTCKSLNKSVQCKSHPKVKVPYLIEKSENTNKAKVKSSLTISDGLSNKTKGSSRLKKTVSQKPNRQDSVSYIKSLHSNQRLNNNYKLKRKNINLEVPKKTIKDLNDLETAIKSSKPSNKRSANFKKSKTFIVSKLIPSTTSEKENASKMRSNFSGHVGQKVNEINEAEHSFHIKGKNGANNYFLLKGLLPKIKKNNHKPGNHKGSISLLKTNVCNEDPFMSIKDKQKNKIDTENEKSALPTREKEDFYTMHDSSNDPDALLITHNSVFSPKCPVHRYKHYLNAKYAQNKSISQKDTGNLSKNKVTILNDLCRMYNKIRSTEKNSSHQLSQKAHNFKPYSTSALPIKKRSSPCPHLDQRKNFKKMPTQKNEPVVAKLPKGFIKKQWITKVLEKDLKTTNPPKNSTYRNVDTQTKEFKASTERLLNLKKKNTNHPTIPIQPQMSETIKIDENFFNLGLDSSYIKRYLQAPPKFTPHRVLLSSKENKKSKNYFKSRRSTNAYNIKWSASEKNNQETKTGSVSVENDILARGTCLDHVRNNYGWNRATRHDLSNDAYCEEQKTDVNSMESSSLSNAFNQYTKDFVKCEYPTNHKLPSIRQLHNSVFRSN